MSGLEEDRVKLDAVVVGGGPAGLMAGLKLAEAGAEVAVIERGVHPGSKNVSGLLYGGFLDKVIPRFWERAPLERPVTRRSLFYIGPEGELGMIMGPAHWQKPPYNRTYVVFRSKFDRWLAGEFEKAGGSLIDSAVVESLVIEGHGEEKRVKGVNIRNDEPFFADIVILADGAAGVVSAKAIEDLNLKRGSLPQTYGLGVKEIIGLPRGKIEDRFNLESGQGVAADYVGAPFSGMIGGGFIYTGWEALAVGFVVKIETLAKKRVKPYEVMDAFKANPAVRKYLEGGELLEYSAHIVPEGGGDAVPRLAAPGLLIAGDAAGLVDVSLYHEGANLAMASGAMAGEVAAAAIKKGDFGIEALGKYEKRLEESFVMKDLSKYRKTPEALDILSSMIEILPGRICNLLAEYFSQEVEPKELIQKKARRDFWKGLPKMKLMRALLALRKVL